MTTDRKEKIKMLERECRELRKTILTMIHEAQSGHPGGSLSAAEIMTVLYFDEMKIYPEDPENPRRDIFVLSKGHVCPVLYSCLINTGCIPRENIFKLRKLGSPLQGHPDMKKCPGVEMSTGSLGQGLSAAVGIAIALKRDGKSNRVFSLVGDGESQEGQIWEAVQVASKYKLDNLTIIVDRNRLQNDGTVEEIMPIGNLADKYKAFGCEVRQTDGHNIEKLIDTFEELRTISGKPKCIVAETVKGKGVSFMEDVVSWHGTAPNDEQFRRAMDEVEGTL